MKKAYIQPRITLYQISDFQLLSSSNNYGMGGNNDLNEEIGGIIDDDFDDDFEIG